MTCTRAEPIPSWTSHLEPCFAKINYSKEMKVNTSPQYRKRNENSDRSQKTNGQGESIGLLCGFNIDFLEWVFRFYFIYSTLPAAWAKPERQVLWPLDTPSRLVIELFGNTVANQAAHNGRECISQARRGGIASVRDWSSAAGKGRLHA